MSWLQISFAVPSGVVESCEEALYELGALSLTLLDEQDEPILEPAPGTTPIWSETRINALFDSGLAPEPLIAALCISIPALQPNQIQVQELADQDWERVWLKDFKPLQFGQDLWVIPETYTAPDANGINLLLDPGLAFGTGTHPTTAMCLEWLANEFRGRYARDAVALDFGCGSGILAIAAAKLGAGQVLVHDIDEQAIIATNANATKNQVADQLKVVDPVHDQLPEIDLIMANILAKPLIQLAEPLAQLAHQGTDLLLSGILQDQADEVMRAYAPYFAVKLVAQQQEWCLLEGRRL